MSLLTHKRNAAPRRRGLSTMVAVAHIALVAAAFASLSVMMRLDKNRTQREVVDAQLRQLLIAGAVYAQDSHSAGRLGAGSVNIPLPVELSETYPASTLSLRIESPAEEADNAALRFNVLANVAQHHADQRITVFVDAPAAARYRVTLEDAGSP